MAKKRGGRAGLTKQTGKSSYQPMAKVATTPRMTHK